MEYLKDLNKKCWECNAIDVPLHRHHPVPISRGGAKTILLCEPCHSKAHHRNKNMATSKLISDSYKKRKELAKKKGETFKWGNPNIMTTAHPLGLQVRKANALKYATTIKNLVNSFDSNNQMTLRERVNRLNEMGSTARRGRPWAVSNLHRVLALANRINNEHNKIL